MRGFIAFALVLGACDKGESAGIEEAKKQAEAEYQERVKAAPPAKKISPPVSGEAKLPCDQVIKAEAFQTALNEKEPLVVKDVTGKKGDTAASCDLLRGGKMLTKAEQDALLKKEGRLGILAGDIVCNVRRSRAVQEALRREEGAQRRIDGRVLVRPGGADRSVRRRSLPIPRRGHQVHLRGSRRPEHDGQRHDPRVRQDRARDDRTGADPGQGRRRLSEAGPDRR
jgi:hypothetical protein